MNTKKTTFVTAPRPSRGTDIDFAKCADAIGGNRFQLVILAAALSRKILRDTNRRGLAELPAAPVTALLEIQQGKFTR